MNLDDLLNEMSEKIRNRDLSDEYLREHNNSTREEIGIGEYAYGITMIPCEWVYEYLSDYKRVLKENEHKTEKIENQKAELAILNEKQKDFNKLQNTLSSYKGQFRRQEKENEKINSLIKKLKEDSKEQQWLQTADDEYLASSDKAMYADELLSFLRGEE